MNVVSMDFENKLINVISDQVDEAIKKIEKHYLNKSKFLNKRNACKYADITLPTLEKWIALGLKIAKINGNYCINTDDIDVFIEKHVI